MKKSLFFLWAVFLLLSLACGQLVIPVEELESAQERAGGLDAPEPAVEEALPTLAPLPVEEDRETAVDAEDGELIRVNDITWTLLDAVYLGEVLESDTDEVSDLVADGLLIGLRFKISNEGEGSHTFIGLEIEDSEGERFTYLVDGLDFIIEEEACAVIDLEPGVTVTCTAIYDIPQEAVALQAVFTDLSLMGGEERLVELDI